MRDTLFAKKFKIKTPIRYLVECEIEKGKESLFHEKWKVARRTADDCLSESRRRAFEAYFRRLEREGDDEVFIRRISIRFVSKKVGYGVFANEDIPPYSTLGHYVGVLRPDQEIDETSDSTFSFSDFPLFSIDAKHSGNWTRFMNHSDEGASQTNLRAWEYYTEESPYIVFTAGPRGIKKGEQLLYSYGDKYWHESDYTQF